MKLFLTLLLIFTSTSVLCKEIKLSSSDGVILFEAADSWDLRHDLFGMENWLFSQKENNSRSNITVTNTKAKIELNAEAIKKEQKAYEKIKQSWADKVQAKVMGYTPLRTLKNSRGNKVSTIGFRYLYKDKVYNESSHYIECRGSLIFAKSLRLEINEPHQKEMDQMIDTMDCSL